MEIASESSKDAIFQSHKNVMCRFAMQWISLPIWESLRAKDEDTVSGFI